MIWRTFRRKASAGHSEHAAWWREADLLAQDPADAAIARLESAATAAAQSDEGERQQEMIEGLRALASVAASSDLPVVATQHRVIGTDVCHFVAPAGLADQTGGGGKLFLTSRRLIFTSASVTALPWHRIRGITRAERDLLIVGGAPDALVIRCNVFGDALVAHHLAGRLRKGPG